MSGDSTLAYGILGVAASTGQFQSSWSGEGLRLNRGKALTWEDKIALSGSGTHSLILSMCFSTFEVCQTPEGDWENISAPVMVTVR